MRTGVKKKRGKSPKVVKKRVFKKDDIPDLRNDPFFVKKGEEVKEILRRSGEVFEEEY